MNRVAPDPSPPDEPTSQAQSVTIPTDNQSTDTGVASTTDSAPQIAWPPNEAPPPYSEQPGDQDRVSERSFEPPPPYDGANGVPSTCDRLRAQPETTYRINLTNTSHHDDDQDGRVSTSCLVVWCIFCPFVFIIGLVVFSIAMCVGMCAEKCCGQENCAGNCRREWGRVCP